MLLTVDLGNTSIKLGVFKEEEQIAFSYFEKNQKDYRALILQFLYKNNLREADIDDAIFSCVVPALYDSVKTALSSIVTNRIIDIDPNDDYGITIDFPDPSKVGDDLIVMCSFAYNTFHRELIVVSMGTYTVICHVDKDGNIKHTIIAPGFNGMIDAMKRSAPHLPDFDPKAMDTFLVNNTVDEMNVGVYNGYIGMVEYLIDNMQAEIDKEVYIIACGGISRQIVPYTEEFDVYMPDLVTAGLHYIYRRFYSE